MWRAAYKTSTRQDRSERPRRHAQSPRYQGEVTDTIRDEIGISQPAVSQHLKVLRESGFVHVRPDGTCRHYRLDAAPLREVDAWVSHFRRFWEQHLDALATELARGQRRNR